MLVYLMMMVAFLLIVLQCCVAKIGFKGLQKGRMNDVVWKVSRNNPNEQHVDSQSATGGKANDDR